MFKPNTTEIRICSKSEYYASRFGRIHPVDINKKRIVVTGAASGIGLAFLKEISQLDTQILAADIDAQGLHQAIKNLSGKRSRTTSFIADLSLKKNTDLLFKKAISQMGGIDLFIANAGFPYYETINKADW